MKPLTPIGSPSPLRLLNKGPDYLRRQMDGGGGGRGHAVSAVERLEADKAKYVKTRQVIDARQEPVLAPCATPPPRPRPRPLPPPRRSPDGDTPFSTLSSSPDENDNDDSRKENRRSPAAVAADVEARNRSNAKRSAAPSPRTPIQAAPVAPRSAPVLRRSTGKRMLRPDSLVIYRQKKECKSPSAAGPPGANNNNCGVEVKGYSFVRRLFQGSMRERGGATGGEGGGAHKMTISEEKAPSRDGGDSRMSWTNDRDAADGAGSRRSSKTDQERPPDACNGLSNGAGDHDDEADPWKRAAPPPPRRRTGELWRSESDLRLRLRCSVALSEQERFFDYCGLDLDMVERLGAENFLSGASSVDTLSLVLRGAGGGSEPSEFSRHSGEGLFQEEVAEQLPPTGVSIIERNARVIKWLYGCRNAAQEGPKESTV